MYADEGYYRIYRCPTTRQMTDNDIIGITTGFTCDESDCFSLYIDEDSDLIPGVTYKYAVAGVNYAGEGFNSNELSVMFGSALPTSITSSCTLGGAYYGNSCVISNNATVVIYPRVRINLNSLTVNQGSKIIANGSLAEPIYFTWQNQNPSSSDRIYLYGSNNEFSYCVFDGGYYNVNPQLL